MSFRKGSRYENTRRFTGTAFTGVRPREIEPAAGVLEHRVLAGQRLDLLALHYYNDDRRWWRILDANPDLLHAGDLTLDRLEGETILIPRARGDG